MFVFREKLTCATGTSDNRERPASFSAPSGSQRAKVSNSNADVPFVGARPRP